MTQNNLCPECSAKLFRNANRCACGWKIIESTAPKKVDNHCDFSYGGRRCPLIGSMSPYVRGETWYCSLHYQSKEDPERSKEVLNYVIENQKQILDERIDWRRKLHG